MAGMVNPREHDHDISPAFDITGEPYVEAIYWLLQNQAHLSRPPASEALQSAFPHLDPSALKALHEYCTRTAIIRTIGPAVGARPAPAAPAELPRDERPWSGAEIAALLKAVEAHPDQWDRVAKAVGTRTPEACLVYFLRFPLSDPFLAPTRAQTAPPSTDTGAPLDDDSDDDQDMAEEDWVASMGFLAAMASPALINTAVDAVLGSVAPQADPAAEVAAARPAASLPDVIDTSVAAAVTVALGRCAAQKAAECGPPPLHHTLQGHLFELRLRLERSRQLEALLERERAELEAERKALRDATQRQRQRELGLVPPEDHAAQ